ncbi:CpsD/CapB family tyrosine-protein kinase [Pullulanibacillus sp. KACC 23026]|uniref:CpsD/CapB family tyrosine-protein kinase n=1 Tax=Pullulanibacillus sp. KACC 23026 TaxID=3028315 RepID=UPI0023B0A35C|nr:CpsD/CapB family tyrosine-protein kinase [Pullulanibacillus sp. KACC 23026]WEG13382.1 CpsD/CapB family tyrosine-protein kinase [Pullulanibacillus sp. KACC 23026]
MAFKSKRRRTEGARKERSLISHYSPKSPTTEQYRTIRTNIEFSQVDKTVRTLVVTSASPGEGKSTTTNNLAVVMAQQGKQVLLIDADLRKPTTHYTFRLANQQGLSTVLTRQSTLEDTIRKTEIDNLFVMSSGPVPPNPAELLTSTAMKKMIEQAKEVFDVIIFDSPPVLAVTDAQILSSYSDGTVLVVASGSTETESAKLARDLLLKSQAKLLGVVLNRKSKKDKNGYYYYYGNS